MVASDSTTSPVMQAFHSHVNHRRGQVCKLQGQGPRRQLLCCHNRRCVREFACEEVRETKSGSSSAPASRLYIVSVTAMQAYPITANQPSDRQLLLFDLQVVCASLSYHGIRLLLGHVCSWLWHSKMIIYGPTGHPADIRHGHHCKRARTTGSMSVEICGAPLWSPAQNIDIAVQDTGKAWPHAGLPAPALDRPRYPGAEDQRRASSMCPIMRRGDSP